MGENPHWIRDSGGVVRRLVTSCAGGGVALWRLDEEEVVVHRLLAGHFQDTS